MEELVGHWNGELVSGGKVWIVETDIERRGAQLAGTADAVGWGVYGLPWDEIRLDGEEVLLRMNVNRTKIQINGRLRCDTITGDYFDGQVKANARLIRQSRVPHVFRSEEITILTEDAELAGTILYPDDAGPYAAVVMGHGSGQFTRDVPSYLGRAHLLARSGLAVLMYDRRGQGESNGDTSRILPMATLSGDMVAAVRTLKSLPQIRSEHIGVYGLSQAGWVVPQAITSAQGEIAFAIVVSAPGITPDSQDVIATGYIEERYLSRALEAAQLPTHVVGDIVANHTAARSRMMAQTAAVPAEVEIIPGFSKFDPLLHWGKVTVPVLAIWGENDRLLPAHHSLDLVTAALKRAGNTHVTAMIFPDATHTLEVDADPGSEWDWDRLAPGFQDTLVSWIHHNVLQ